MIVAAPRAAAQAQRRSCEAMEATKIKRSEIQLQACFDAASRQRQGILDEGGGIAGLDVEEVRQAEREAGGGAGDLEVARWFCAR